MGEGSHHSLLDDRDSKVFNDPIHGHIEFNSLCIDIIDTPQFQRLRYIKQLGAGYYVFPGASHNRFEHSLGVGHLAGELVDTLRRRQPELHITDVDVLCVKIAGLCHDLGHGPFSHMFDSKFIPQSGSDVENWRHEDASVKMFDYLIEVNHLKERFEAHGLTDPDIVFIKEQIAGPLNVKNTKDGWNYSGRGKEKSFLYEIVANKRNGIDVDKWDYFARDCHHLGIPKIFDHRRFMQFARVIEVDGLRQICSRDKEVGNVYDMFYTRNALHRRAYQHKNCVIIEYMLNEALLLANEHLTFPGKDGKMLKLSDTIKDMQAYTLVNDSVYHTIRQSQHADLAESRHILEAIERREIYKCVGQSKSIQTRVNLKEDFNEEKIQLKIAEYSRDFNIKLDKNDVIVQFCKYDYGKGKRNPINDVRFYSKNGATMKFKRDEVSRMTPEIFCEEYVRVYSRIRDAEIIPKIRQCFERFCANNGFLPPKGGDPGSVGLTPIKHRLGADGGDDVEDSESDFDLSQPERKKGKKIDFEESDNI